MDLKFTRKCVLRFKWWSSTILFKFHLGVVGKPYTICRIQGYDLHYLCNSASSSKHSQQEPTFPLARKHPKHNRFHPLSLVSKAAVILWFVLHNRWSWLLHLQNSPKFFLAEYFENLQNAICALCYTLYKWYPPDKHSPFSIIWHVLPFEIGA